MQFVPKSELLNRKQKQTSYMKSSNIAFSAFKLLTVKNIILNRQLPADIYLIIFIFIYFSDKLSENSISFIEQRIKINS